jgi:amidohydrolase
MQRQAACTWCDGIDDIVDQKLDHWIQWRRHLHSYPERSWHETGTTEFIARKIEGMGLEFHPGPRQLGGTVDLEFGEPRAPRGLAFRCDIDAIPVDEANDLPWKSHTPGVMHACGHDVHATTGLAICETLQELGQRELLPCPVRIRVIFQPAEEVGEGAREFIAAGALNEIDAIFAMHVDPSRLAGMVGFRDGVQTACCDDLQIEIRGTGGHGARPHETGDTILAAASLIQSAHALVPRIVDARENTVLSFCSIHGGASSNVVPTDVQIRGTLRTFATGPRTAILSRLETLARSVGESFGVAIHFHVRNSVPSVRNCPRLNELARGIAVDLLSPKAAGEALPSLGGEDFAFYQQQIPGALLRMGSAAPDGKNAWLHSPNFDVNEQVLSVAPRLLVRCLVSWFHSG